MTHFRIADKFIDIIGADKLDLPSFVFGNIAPDCGMPSSDGITYIPDKETSHFGHSDNRDYKGFITKYLYIKTDLESYSFYLGYYLHLLTDKEWVFKINRPEENKFLSYFPDKKCFNQAIKRDWYDQDKLFLKHNPAFRAFAIFSNIKRFPNKFLDFFSETAFDWQLDRIRSFYLTPGKDLEREYKYLTEKEMNDFIDNAVNSMKDQMLEVINK